MLLADFIHSSISSLEKLYPFAEARAIVLALCSDVLGTKSYTHILEPSTIVPTDKLDYLNSCIQRLSAGEPLQYVLGYTEFRNRKFNVNPSVLIPRPETEQLVDLVLEALTDSGSRVLDLCTGSGCIAWSIALERPDTKVVAVDISSSALSVAKSQFDSAAVDFIQADILEEATIRLLEEKYPDGFDIIVSNPPYIMEKEKAQMRSNVLDYEPGLALFVPDNDPLVFYKAIAKLSKRLLKPTGTGLVELNDALIFETEQVFKDADLVKTCQKTDFFSRKRFLIFNR